MPAQGKGIFRGKIGRIRQELENIVPFCSLKRELLSSGTLNEDFSCSKGKPMNRVQHILHAIPLGCVLSFPAGAREPVRSFPVPQTVSPELQTSLDSPPPDYGKLRPQHSAERKAWAAEFANRLKAQMPDLCNLLHVTASAGNMGGVPLYHIRPEKFPETGQNRIMLHFHVGGHVPGQGLSEAQEAVLMAGIGKFGVVSVDCEMAPDVPYPAAIDNALAVCRELLRTASPDQIWRLWDIHRRRYDPDSPASSKGERASPCGSSRSRPPWTDLSKTDDSYFTNEHVDNLLVSHGGWRGAAAALYVETHDLKDPMLSRLWRGTRLSFHSAHLGNTRSLSRQYGPDASETAKGGS